MTKRNQTNKEKFHQKYIAPLVSPLLPLMGMKDVSKKRRLHRKSNHAAFNSNTYKWDYTRARHLMDKQPDHRVVMLNGYKSVRSTTRDNEFETTSKHWAKQWGWSTVADKPAKLASNEVYLCVEYKPAERQLKSLHPSGEIVSGKIGSYGATFGSITDWDEDDYYGRNRPVLKKIFDINNPQGVDSLIYALKSAKREAQYIAKTEVLIHPYANTSPERLLARLQDMQIQNRTFAFTNCFTPEAAMRNVFEGHEIFDNLCIVNNSSKKEQSFWNIVEQDDANGHFNVVRLFHGTSIINALKILDSGFKLGYKGGAFGAGIYFGEPAKAQNYIKFNRESSFKKCIKETKYRPSDLVALDLTESAAIGLNKRALTGACLLEVDVALGNCYSSFDNEEVKKHLDTFAHTYNDNKTSTILKMLADNKSNSLFYDGYARGEYVLYEPARVIVRKIHIIPSEWRKTYV